MGLADERWTADQRRAIETVDRSVVVSAGAGSGKTAVLARRCSYLAADAPPPFRCDIDELLVVTFTEAAAAEMRLRIARELRARAAAEPGSARLRQQAALVDAAAISTIHAFCRSVLVRWFTEAGLDPAFEMLDADEAELLKRETVEEVMRELYEDEGEEGARFRRFVDDYAEGSDERVGEMVVRLADYLGSVVDPEGWLAEAAQPLREARERGALPETYRVKQRSAIAGELSRQSEEAGRAQRYLRDGVKGAAWYAERLDGYVSVLEEWRGTARGDGGEAVEKVIAAMAEYPFPDLRGAPRVDKDDTEAVNAKEIAKKVFDEVRTAFRGQLQERWGLFSAAEWAEGLARIADPVEVIVELVRRFGRAYAAAKAELGALDFGDLERKTLELLMRAAGENEIARALRAKYRHVLVDEFQDVNPVQERILRLVSRHGQKEEAGNLFCVGDAKQSIYRFRLAEPEILVRRERESDGSAARGAVVRLRENFRGREEVLAGINLLFERIMTPAIGAVVYDEGARLRAGLAYPEAVEARPCVEVHLLERRIGEEEKEDEAEDGGAEGVEERAGGESVAEWESAEREAYRVGVIIRRMMGLEAGYAAMEVWERAESAQAPKESVPHPSAALKGGAPNTGAGERDEGAADGWRRRKVCWRDIVILLRAPRHKANIYARVLGAMDIPLHSDVAGGFFDEIEVREMVALLNLLDNRKQDIPLAAVLRSPVIGPAFDETELLLIRSMDETVPYHEAFAKYVAAGPDAALREKCGAMERMLRRMREEARQRPVAEVLWEIYTETGALGYVGGLPGGRQRRANLIALHERARQFGTFARQGLHRFVRFLEELEAGERDPGAAAAAGEGDDVVRLMSVHGAKGLEFPIVIAADLGKKFNLDDARGRIVISREEHIGCRVIDAQRNAEYPSLAHVLAATDSELQTRAEEMRVLYVALTRARERLVLVGTAPLANVEMTRSRWAGHEGALPGGVLRRANCALDWVLPVLCARDGREVHWVFEQEGGLRCAPPTLQPKRLIDVHVCDAETVRGWEMPERRAETGRALRERVASLEALPAEEPVAVESAYVERTLRRVRLAYGDEALTVVPSALSASELKRRHQAVLELEESARREAVRSAPARRPGFIDEGAAAAGALDRGVATHAVLQHIDLRGAADAAAIERQIEELIGARRIGRAEAALVDREAIAWFFETEIGRRMRAAPERVRRELMFVSHVEPHEYDAGVAGRDERDRILVRGVIDVVMQTDEGTVIVDYKTDTVGANEVAARAAGYRAQVEVYAKAVEQMGLGRASPRVLVFLHPRRIIEI